MFCGERPFAAHTSRCSPPLTDYVAFRRLLSTARSVLCEGLSEELCNRSTGFLPDTAVEAERKTVALLLDVRGNVAAAMVYTTDLGRVASQVLVAGTSARHRQQGCMRRLLAAVRAQLVAAGLSELCLAVAKGNTVAARCWSALGFYAAGQWPTRFSPVQTSSDLGTIFRLPLLPPPEPRKLRWAAVSEPPPPLARGVPPTWPGAEAGGVPFVSHCGLPAGVPPSLLPTLHQPALAVRPTEPGAWGLFAARALVPGYPLCCFGGEMVRVREGEPPPPGPPRVTLEGGMLELSTARCGNECRYLRVNLQRSNARLRLRYDPLTGAALVLLCLVRPVQAGERIELEDWSLLPSRPRSSAKRRARRVRC